MGAGAGRLKIPRRARMEPRNPGTSKPGTNDPGKPALRWVATRQISQCLRSRPVLSCILPEKLMFVCPLKRQSCTQSHGKTVSSCDDADKLMFVSCSPVKLPWRPSSVKQIHFLFDAGWLSSEKSYSLVFLITKSKRQLKRQIIHFQVMTTRRTACESSWRCADDHHRLPGSLDHSGNS